MTFEARGSGCVLLVSEAAGAVCKHMDNALVHRVGDVNALTQQITLIHEDRALLKRLRAASLETAPEVTWTAPGVRLLQVYRQVVADHARRMLREPAGDTANGASRQRNPNLCARVEGASPVKSPNQMPMQKIIS